jgi:hypothetical protein
VFLGRKSRTVTQAKVIPLNPASNRKSPLPPILHTVRQQARKSLSGLLEGLFNNVDDALFEMADRSRNDIDQHLYFESMRELRLKREEICQVFAQALLDGFVQAFTSEEKPAEDFENISMVGNDELEISVAIAGIVSKVTSQHSLLIMQLTRRFDFLAKNAEITERRNPLGPEMLSQAFVTGLASAELDIKIRIILLKLFERFVMERLADIYTLANRQLSEAGVLKDLKKISRLKQEQSGSQTSPTAATPPAQGAGQIPAPLTGITPERVPHNEFATETVPGAMPETASESLSGSASRSGSAPGSRPGGNFQLIQSLLATRREPADHTTTTNGPHPDTLVALTTADLLLTLSEAQRRLNAPIDVETVPALLDLRALVTSKVPESRLAQPEEDVVNFVGMLFDYILNDRNLAIPMKALIGRLQLPIVKLAIMDRTFFERSNHPARLLLNELSSAGIGWSNTKELKRDALYDKVEAVVLGVVNGFRDNPAVFGELLGELRAFTSAEEQRREFVEQRVKDSEEGRAKRIGAKQSVQKLINQKAAGMRLPADVGRFISDVWARVLVYSSVKHGAGSPDWHQYVQTLDELLWCLQPLDNLGAIDERDGKVPALLENLRTGMTEIQIASGETDKLLEEIQGHLTRISRNDRVYLEDDEPMPADDSLEVMDEVVLTRAEEDLDEQVSVDEIDPACIEQVDQLRVGAWVELRQNGETVARCKLSTIVEPGARYIFVNRRGMKVAERSHRGLAADLQTGRMTILDESQVFDRALQAVIGNLREMQGSA